MMTEKTGSCKKLTIELTEEEISRIMYEDWLSEHGDEFDFDEPEQY